jgi:hypothetical protein
MMVILKIFYPHFSVWIKIISLYFVEKKYIINADAHQIFCGLKHQYGQRAAILMTYYQHYLHFFPKICQTVADMYSCTVHIYVVICFYDS